MEPLPVADAVFYRQDRRRIRTVEVHAGTVRWAADTLGNGAALYRVANVYLGWYDGEAAFAGLAAKVAAGEALSRNGAVHLAFIPLLGLRERCLQAAAVEALTASGLAVLGCRWLAGCRWGCRPAPYRVPASRPVVATAGERAGRRERAGADGARSLVRCLGCGGPAPPGYPSRPNTSRLKSARPAQVRAKSSHRSRVARSRSAETRRATAAAGSP